MNIVVPFSSMFYPVVEKFLKKVLCMVSVLLFVSFSLAPIPVRILPILVVFISVTSDLHITIYGGHFSVHIVSYQWRFMQLTTPSSLNCFFHLTSRISCSQLVVLLNLFPSTKYWSTPGSIIEHLLYGHSLPW